MSDREEKTGKNDNGKNAFGIDILRKMYKIDFRTN